jgi:hypothetical protein
LISPLGVANFDLVELIKGNWASWQFLLMALSAVINLICFPYFLSASAECFKSNNPRLSSYCFATWIALIVVAGGNFIVHDRYRVMATLLLFGTYWLGYQSSLILIKRYQKIWISIVLFLCIFYLLFKLARL